jgi:DNA-binding NarL/FixJ family response regulator
MANDSKEKISVIVVDDHTLFRVSLKVAFHSAYSNIEVIGEADSSDALFKILPTRKANIVLLDINLPDIGGVEIARRLRRDYPDIKILAVSAEIMPETIRAMIDIGIDGFISKQKADTDELIEAIQAIMDGFEYFGRDISAIIYDVYVAKKKTAAITPEFTEREKDIILLCRDGLMYKEIADRLCISVNTIRTHKKNIFQKLGINNTMEMVQYALKNGIIGMED